MGDGKRGSHHWIMIPPTVFAHKGLSTTEKLLFGKIFGLINEEGYAFCSNAYLAQEMDLDKRSVQRCLQNIEKAGFINVKQKDGRRRLYANPINGGDTNVTGGDVNVTGGVTKMSPVNSNTSNKGYPVTESNTVTSVTKETNSNLITNGNKGFSEEVVEIFEYYKKALVRLANIPEEQVGKMRLRAGSTGRVGHINARLKEGYTVKQIKQAIVALCRDEWYVERGLLDLEYVIGNTTKIDRALMKYEAQERRNARGVKEFRG